MRPILFLRYKMNKIVNKFLLPEDKFGVDVHFKTPGFTYSTCELCTIVKKEYKNSKIQ